MGGCTADEAIQPTLSFFRDTCTAQAAQAQGLRFLFWLFFTGALVPSERPSKQQQLLSSSVQTERSGSYKTGLKVEVHMQESIPSAWYYPFFMPLQETQEINDPHDVASHGQSPVDQAKGEEFLARMMSWDTKERL